MHAYCCAVQLLHACSHVSASPACSPSCVHTVASGTPFNVSSAACASCQCWVAFDPQDVCKAVQHVVGAHRAIRHCPGQHGFVRHTCSSGRGRCTPIRLGRQNSSKLALLPSQPHAAAYVQTSREAGR